MSTLIIYAHPWDGSFNHHILEKTKELLNKQGKSVKVIDLNKDGFNPVMQQADLALFAKGEFADPLAANYAKLMRAAEELVLIFPIWWYGEPAILKGFYDKVLLKGHLYDEENHQLVGLLKAKKATILTTANIDKKIFSHLGDPIRNVLSHGILGTIGITDSTWIHCPTVHLEDSRIKYLSDIDNHFRK